MLQSASDCFRLLQIASESFRKHPKASECIRDAFPKEGGGHPFLFKRVVAILFLLWIMPVIIIIYNYAGNKRERERGGQPLPIRRDVTTAFLKREEGSPLKGEVAILER